MIAAGWTWPAAFVVVAFIVAFSFVAVASMASRFAKGVPTTPVGPRRFDAIEEDLALIRSDLAELKEAIAELDRLFKSVG